MFSLPAEYDMADMLRADLADARAAWLEQAKRDPDEYARRDESDFLSVANHDGELVDFHALRHTCGAWLAMASVHPKVVQTVMRHSTITLTMDTYGHLFPGQEADAVDQLRDVIGDGPTALQATGTDTAVADDQKDQRSARRSAKQCVFDANPCDEPSTDAVKRESPKPLQIADLDDALRVDATANESRPGEIRTPEQGIMSSVLDSTILC